MLDGRVNAIGRFVEIALELPRHVACMGLFSERVKGVRKWWRHAFAVEQPSRPLTAAQTELINSLAIGIVQRELTTPVVLAIESSEPLAYVSSQLAVSLTPIARLVVDDATWKELVPLLERRDVAQQLLLAIESRASQ